MNETLRVLKERRSIRGFKPELPPREQIDAVIEAGLYAPSGMGRQGAIVIAVTDPKIRARLAEENRKPTDWEEDFDPFYGAPVILSVLADRSVPTWVYDGSLMMGNMLNAAHSLGLGSIWIHRAAEVFESEAGKAILADLGIEGDYMGVGHCALGYIDGEYPETPERNPGRVFWVE